MADQLFLSVWYPNFRLEALGPAVLGVLRQFAVAGAVSGDSATIHAATVYPIDWSEAPVYERIYDEDDDQAEAAEARPAVAVPAAMQQLHADFAYEFETSWQLWQAETEAGLDPVWREQPSPVTVTAFGPEFDDAGYITNGQVRISFGIDSPFLHEEVALDPHLAGDAAGRVRENVARLLAVVHAIEKNCGISSRRLWSESGESLAEKLVARLEQVN